MTALVLGWGGSGCQSVPLQEEATAAFRSSDSLPLWLGRQDSFIVSLNQDDDNMDGRSDRSESLPNASEDNLLELRLDPQHFRQKPRSVRATVLHTANEESQVRLWHADRRTPVLWNRRQELGETLFVEGLRPSSEPDDIHLALEFFDGNNERLTDLRLTGTVVSVNINIDADKGEGAPLARHHKMLITGKAALNVDITPAVNGNVEWQYDGDGEFVHADGGQVIFQAGETFTPVASIGRCHLTMQWSWRHSVIESELPLSLVAPRSLQLMGDAVVISSTGWIAPHQSRFDLIDHIFRYRILDQEGAGIRDCAYAGKWPQARENIGNILYSDIPELQEFLLAHLNHSPNWVNIRRGLLSDRIRATGFRTRWLLDSDEKFKDVLFRPGATLLGLNEGDFHVWQLSVNGRGVVDVTQNTYRCEVTNNREQNAAKEIRFRALYEVHLP